MLLEVEAAKSAAYYAGWAAAEDNEELPVAACLAKAYCSEAYFHAAAENIQIHGGIGFTWEHDAHLYFKRAKSSELILGDPAYHRNCWRSGSGSDPLRRAVVPPNPTAGSCRPARTLDIFRAPEKGGGPII